MILLPSTHLWTGGIQRMALFDQTHAVLETVHDVNTVAMKC